jgi:hypothetical protein
MAFIQCEILHLTVKLLLLIFFKGFFSKISVLEMEIGENGSGILGVKYYQ